MKIEVIREEPKPQPKPPIVEVVMHLTREEADFLIVILRNGQPRTENPRRRYIANALDEAMV